MPELPEVEVVRAGLAPFVTGMAVEGVEILDSRSLKRHDRRLGDFESCVIGHVFDTPTRRGKFLWIGFRDDEEHALLAHLGMSGQILVNEPGHHDNRLARITLHLHSAPDDNRESTEWVLSFVDQRIFGSLAVDTLVKTGDHRPGGWGSRDPRVPSQVAHIARDVLDPAFDDDGFVRTLHTRQSGIKRVVLDQSVISGIGNIYADEALWAARLHYEQPAASLSDSHIRALLYELRVVLERALAEGGTSFDSQYVNVNGRSGYFAHSLNVYAQHGKPCSRCGEPLVRERFMNRYSHLCPSCQQLR